MDEASTHVQAKAQEPHDQKNHANCPKHDDPPLAPVSRPILEIGDSGALVIAWGNLCVSPLLLTWLVTIAHPLREGPFDLISTNGFIRGGIVHTHVTFANPLKAMGGHFEPGTRVFTFAIVTLGILL